MAKPTQSVRAPAERATKSAAVVPGRAGAKRSGPKRNWQPAFLLALAETSNVSAAASAAGVQPSYPYKVKRDDNRFAQAWREALCEGYDNLELELLHRLPDAIRHGVIRLCAHQHRGRDDERKAAAVPPSVVAALWRPWRRMRLA